MGTVITNEEAEAQYCDHGFPLATVLSNEWQE